MIAAGEAQQIRVTVNTSSIMCFDIVNVYKYRIKILFIVTLIFQSDCFRLNMYFFYYVRRILSWKKNPVFYAHVLK